MPPTQWSTTTFFLGQEYLDSLESVGLMADERSGSFLDDFLRVSGDTWAGNTM